MQQRSPGAFLFSSPQFYVLRPLSEMEQVGESVQAFFVA